MYKNIYGHNNAKSRLIRIIEDNRLAHAYLFSGPAKVGKFSMAVEFAKNIIGEKFRKDMDSYIFPDLTIVFPFLKKDMKAESNYLVGMRKNIMKQVRENAEVDIFAKMEKNANISIDVIRELIIYSNKTAYIADKKVIIIKNAEKMRKEGANSFLKLLEEPPSNTILILTTDNLNSILPTIVSRCQLMKFGYLSNDEIRDYIKEKDGQEISEDALNLMDGTFENIRTAELITGITDRESILEMILNREEKSIMDLLRKIIAREKNKEEMEKKKREKKTGKKERKEYKSDVGIKQTFLLYLIKILLQVINAAVIEKKFEKRKDTPLSKYKTERLNSITDELIQIEGDIKRNIPTERIIKYLITLFSVKEVSNVCQS